MSPDTCLVETVLRAPARAAEEESIIQSTQAKKEGGKLPRLADDTFGLLVGFLLRQSQVAQDDFESQG